MTYKRFEDLPVWKAAIELAERIFRLAEDRGFNYKGDLRSQLQRATLSVSNNIAEGFERGTTQELLTFLYIARGSAGEVRSMLHFCERLPALHHLKSQISDLTSLSESVSRQLLAWADSLQNTDIKGQRHLSDQARREHEHNTRAERFLAHLERVRAGAAPADLFDAVPNE